MADVFRRLGEAHDQPPAAPEGATASPSINALSIEELHEISVEQIGSWTIAQLQGIDPGQLAKLLPMQVAALNGAHIRSLTTPQLQALRDVQLRALDPIQVQAFSEMQLTAFSNSQRSALRKESAEPKTPPAQTSNVRAIRQPLKTQHRNLRITIYVTEEEKLELLDISGTDKTARRLAGERRAKDYSESEAAGRIFRFGIEQMRKQGLKQIP